MKPELILDQNEKESLEEVRASFSELLSRAELTPEQLEKFPTVTPEVLTNTGAKEVAARFVALKELGYQSIHPEKFVKVPAYKDKAWSEVETPAPDYRSEVITAFLFMRFINEMVLLRTGLAVHYSVENGGLTRKIVSYPDFMGKLTPEAEAAAVNQFIGRCLEHRVDTTNITDVIPGFEHMTFDVAGRMAGNKPNPDGKVPMGELAQISKKVVEAFASWKSKS